MPKWLHGIWISPSEHQEIVEELHSRITQLERDFVEVAQSLIRETEARRRAEYVRNDLLRLRGGNVVVLGLRKTQRRSDGIAVVAIRPAER